MHIFIWHKGNKSHEFKQLKREKHCSWKLFFSILLIYMNPLKMILVWWFELQMSYIKIMILIWLEVMSWNHFFWNYVLHFFILMIFDFFCFKTMMHGFERKGDACMESINKLKQKEESIFLKNFLFLILSNFH